jgi:hypothetical protein
MHQNDQGVAAPPLQVRRIPGGFRMKKIIAMLVMGTASLVVNGAQAHGTPTANHGGVVIAVGETWLELVANAGSVDLYVEDDGDPTDTAKLSGKLTIINGAKKNEFTLTPAGGNRLEAKGAVAAKGSKVTTLLVLADKTKVPATFNVK